MMITDIKKEKKHLCRIFFDCGREELLDTDIVLENCLHKEDHLSEEKLCELIEASDYYRAKQRALWYLDTKAYTEKELYRKLTEKGFKKEASAKVIARFLELGLLDDRRFAENYLERLYSQNTSKREAYYKMMNKGFPKDLITELINGSEVDERQQIREVLEKKYRTKLSNEENIKKVYAALIRKGFSFSAVKEELKAYSEELALSFEENREEF